VRFLPDHFAPQAEPAPPAVSARAALRAATAQAHARLDRLYSAFDLGAPDGYADFLLAHAPAFLAVEQALDAAGTDTLVPGWRARMRSQSLRQDIAALGRPIPAPAAAPLLCGEPQTLGAMYVLEGSRLGAAVLIRQVAAGLPTAFLAPGNPAHWRAFISRLDLRLSSAESLAQATSAALAVFTLFGQSARALSEPVSLE
jgi:heme oxygenase